MLAVVPSCEYQIYVTDLIMKLELCVWALSISSDCIDRQIRPPAGAVAIVSLSTIGRLITNSQP